MSLYSTLRHAEGAQTSRQRYMPGQNVRLLCCIQELSTITGKEVLLTLPSSHADVAMADSSTSGSLVSNASDDELQQGI